MVLGIGFISAILIAKKHYRKNKSRLGNLRQQLKKTPLKKLILYQFPTKLFISILIIISLVIFFNYFENWYLNQLSQEQVNTTTTQYLLLLQLKDNYGMLGKILIGIKIIYGLCIVGIVSQAKFKIVTIEPNKLTIISYNYTKFRQQKTIIWCPTDTIKIISKGEQRFTNNTNYYTLQLIKKQPKQFLSQQIINRSSLYYAKKNIIQISSILNFIPDLKIH